nr:hypothetical protein [Tanacetum cinerariifolium]
MKKGSVYFVYGYGGTGKTFIWKTLVVGIRRRGDIVLNVESNGIASLLMSGGRTAHFRFHIPINVDDTSHCFISAQSDTEALLKRCKLIIWDEAPMVNKLCFEALDRSLRDILCKNRYDRCEQPFGNMTMVFSGDFRQLTANMMLTVGAPREDVTEIRKFTEWILKVGDGGLGEPNDGVVFIDLSDEIVVDVSDDPEIHALMTKVVDNINNHHLLKKFPGEERVYLSCDSVDKAEGNAAIDQSIFSHEFIDGLKSSRVLNHMLALKVVLPIMLLRNIDRLQILKLTRTSISAKVINGPTLERKGHINRGQVFDPHSLQGRRSRQENAIQEHGLHIHLVDDHVHVSRKCIEDMNGLDSCNRSKRFLKVDAFFLMISNATNLALFFKTPPSSSNFTFTLRILSMHLYNFWVQQMRGKHHGILVENPVRIIPSPASIVQLAKIRRQSDIHGGGDDSVLSTQEYMKQVVEDVGEDEDFNSGSWLGATDGVGGSGMLMEKEEIVKLMEAEEMADLKLHVCGNVIDQEDLYKFDEEVLDLVLKEEARESRAHEE